MPIIASAKKRVRTTRKATVRNSKTKRSLKGALKVFAKSPSGKSISAAQSQIDRAAKKGVIHKNKAARLKSQAAKRAKAAGVKSTKATKKAAPAKRVTAKKSTAKKK
ncbi:MAG TPA: 30S ribosomal protein S20 [Candidatus Dormibacteraeota bacterium]|nr:30S ribosomal protein S20 [Candidatus Dormibacteraeota bacterium]